MESGLILVMESTKGEKGSSISYNISLNAGVFGILGDLWNEMGKASVWLNGERVASIDKSMIVDTDINRMKTAHRSFRQVLYFMKLDKTNIKENKIEVKVESGTFIFNWILTDCPGKECIFNNIYHKPSPGPQPQPDPQPQPEPDPQPETDPIAPNTKSPIPLKQGPGENLDQKLQKTLTKPIQIVIIAASALAAIMVILVIVIVGIKKGWCSKQEDESSEIDISLDF